MTTRATSRLATFTRIASYVFLLIQWSWLFVLYSAWALESGAFQSYIDATQTASPQESAGFELPEFIRQPLGIVVVISMVVLSVTLLIRTPKKATQLTIRATNTTAKSITPVVEKALHVPKKQKKQLAESVLAGVIVLFSILACVLTIPIMNLISLPAYASWPISVSLSVFTPALLLVSMLLGHVSRKHDRSHRRDV